MTIERWDIFELTLDGPTEGNPFIDVDLRAEFRYGHRVLPVEGFYDGDGTYRIRFMPDEVGEWQYQTRSNAPELDGREGTFTCTPASGDNHGPVRVAQAHHFQYADSTPYFPVGTTCYAWVHQGDELEEQTLSTLASAPFNKMRMCVFPKHYTFSQNEPVHHPFEGSIDDGWDFTRFNPAFFRHLEQRVGQLRDLGIEADLILFHPYDRWGYADMGLETDERYLHYLVARLAAYRNIWWSFANEYDLMKAKTIADWDRYFQLVQTLDPVQHLRSVHNCRPFYDHGKPWVTHCSIQHRDLSRTVEWRTTYGKPVVDDECCYEGNIHLGWGNITAQELVNRFWEGFARGGFVGHGETYMHPEDILWWSKGGVLHGESPARIRFLRDIMEAGPPALDPQPVARSVACAGVAGEYYLVYLGPHQSSLKDLHLPDDIEFRIEIIDTWGMTIEEIEGAFSGACKVQLPGRPYTALRIRRV